MVIFYNGFTHQHRGRASYEHRADALYVNANKENTVIVVWGECRTLLIGFIVPVTDPDNILQKVSELRSSS